MHVLAPLPAAPPLPGSPIVAPIAAIPLAPPSPAFAPSGNDSDCEEEDSDSDLDATIDEGGAELLSPTELEGSTDPEDATTVYPIEQNGGAEIPAGPEEEEDGDDIPEDIDREPKKWFGIPT